MTIIEVGRAGPELTLRQRYSHYFAIGFAVISVIIGINLRDATLNATVAYSDVQAGIRTFYPQNWLLDTDGDYVFRVRAMLLPGFKTTIQVAVRPVALNITPRNLLDDLNLNRAQTLAAYAVLESQPTTLGDSPATAVRYTYVARDDNPFLQSLPIVVEGLDIIVSTGGQALLVTFLAQSDRFDQEVAIFERFLADLEF
jgi:hypothetical protein